jgi:prevent-host-death family protein
MEVSVYAAKTQLSRLLDRAAKGEEIVITRHGRPVAKLVSAGPGGQPRRLGRLRGRIRVGSDFDAPRPEDVLNAFEGKGRKR